MRARTYFYYILGIALLLILAFEFGVYPRWNSMVTLSSLFIFGSVSLVMCAPMSSLIFPKFFVRMGISSMALGLLMPLAVINSDIGNDVLVITNAQGQYRVIKNLTFGFVPSYKGTHFTNVRVSDQASGVYAVFTLRDDCVISIAKAFTPDQYRDSVVTFFKERLAEAKAATENATCPAKVLCAIDAQNWRSLPSSLPVRGSWIEIDQFLSTRKTI